MFGIGIHTLCVQANSDSCDETASYTDLSEPLLLASGISTKFS